MVIAFIEESADQFSINNQENERIAQVAQMYGCRIHYLPATLEEHETLEDALIYVPNYEEPIGAVWVGFIPTFEKYAEVYRIAASKNIFLLNSPAEHQVAQEFDCYYSLLGDLTPKSAVLTSLESCSEVGAELGFPLFVRGAVKSNKDQGWQACVANNESQLRTLVEQVLQSSSRARGRVIVRQLVQLKHLSKMPGDFPRGREYRVFVYQQEILASGYYWDEFSDEFPLTESDAQAIWRIALEAAKRVQVPFMMADVGQLETGEWIIIEVGDAQFAGLSNVPILELWSKLAAIGLESQYLEPHNKNLTF